MKAAPLHALTSLRFLAALIVVFFHRGQLTALAQAPDWLRNIAGAGYVGVGVFFILSGFILTYVYSSTVGPLPRPAFWRARVARIYPLYLLALLISAPYSLSWMLRDGTMAAGMLSPLLLQSWWPHAAIAWNAPGWSLSVEALFYVLFPLFIPAVARLRARQALYLAACAWIALLIPVMLCGLLIDGAWQANATTAATWIEILKYNPLAHLGEFLMGMATARLFMWRPTWATGRLAAGAALVSLVVLAASPQLPYILLHGGLLAPVFAALILGLAGVRRGLMTARPIVALGEASYALYLLHIPIWWYMTRFLPSTDSALGFWGYLVVCLGVSFAAYHWVEVPGRRWINRWGASARAQPGTT